MRQLAACRHLPRRSLLACGLTRLSPVLALTRTGLFFAVVLPIENVAFRNDVIVRGRACLDSAMVARLFAENPIG
jgi:hypothetical protein